MRTENALDQNRDCAVCVAERDAWMVGPYNDQCEFEEGREDDVREGLDELGRESAVLGCAGDASTEQTESVRFVDLAPPNPSHDGRSVEEDDLSHHRLTR